MSENSLNMQYLEPAFRFMAYAVGCYYYEL